MVITNFAAGELSPDLYGRNDLQAYYQGAAKLENVDIIPTGGVEKRQGIRLVSKLTEDLSRGRIIPFYISETENFLVLLLPALKMIIYKIGVNDTFTKVFEFQTSLTREVKESIVLNPEDGNGPVISLQDKPPDNNSELQPGISVENPKLPDVITLFTEPEISEVKYAQRTNIMIFVHKNHWPIELDYNGSDNFALNNFEIRTVIKLVPDDLPNIGHFAENDNFYGKNLYLTSNGNYPGTVSFFMGRLVFGGTINNPQRLFFSSVNDIHDFTTYKKYITEQKEYVVIYCMVHEGLDTVDIDTSYINSFKKPLDTYIIDNEVIFPANTRIKTAASKTLVLTNKAYKYSNLTYEELDAWNSWLSKYRAIKQISVARKGIWSGHGTGSSGYGGPANIDVVVDVYFAMDYTQISCWCHQKLQASGTPTDDSSATRYFSDTDYRDNFDPWSWMKRTLSKKAKWGIDWNWYESSWAPNGNNVNQLRNLTSQIIDTFHYTFKGTTYYKTADQIYSIMNGRFGDTPNKNYYLPFYSMDYIVDSNVSPDDGMTFELDSEKGEEIKWIVQNKNIIIGTQNSEYVIPNGITATNKTASLNSKYGSSQIQAATIGDATLFFMRGSRRLVEYYIPQADNYFRTNDILYLASHILAESKAKEIAFMGSPWTNIFILKENGTIARLLYDRTLGIQAWTTIDFKENIKALSIAVLPNKYGYESLFILMSIYHEVSANFDYTISEMDFGNEKIYLDNYEKWNSEVLPEDEGKVYLRQNKDGSFKEVKATDFNSNDGLSYYKGYKYDFYVKTLPILSNTEMKKQRISRILMRLQNSFIPIVESYENSKLISSDIISDVQPPKTGVINIHFNGTWGEDVQIGLKDETANPIKILSINGEAE